MDDETLAIQFRMALAPVDLDDREMAEWMREREVPGWRLADKGF